jgi:hypothetical protein
MGFVMQLPARDEIVLISGIRPIRAKRARPVAQPRNPFEKLLGIVGSLCGLRAATMRSRASAQPNHRGFWATRKSAEGSAA